MTSPRRSRGFSLIELMIGIMLGLIILAALTSFFVSSSAARYAIERTSRQIENGRYAMNAVRDEIHLAGFYAELQTSGTTWGIPDPCDSSLAGQGFVLSPQATPLPISGYAADIAKPACLPNQVPQTDVLVIRRFHTEPFTKAAGVAAGGDFYYQPSRCRTDSTTTPWEFNTGAAGTFGLLKLDCATAADLYRWRVNIFYIRDYSFTPGDLTPTLVKLELDPTNPTAVNGIVTLPIAEGISDMRLEYGVDNNGDGAPDEWRRCDAATACTMAQWANVTAVRVHLLSMNTEDDRAYNDTKEYDLGTGASAIASDPNFIHRQKHVYASVISAPNRAGPRE